jgi:hypothetical protein
MYYSFPCPYCRRLFYTYTNNKHQAASTLYYGIKRHQKEYGEDEKEHTLDDEYITTEINRIYTRLNASDDEPSGAYEV